MAIACSHCKTILPVDPSEAGGAIVYCGGCGRPATPVAVARPAAARPVAARAAGGAPARRGREARAPSRPTGRAYRGAGYPRRSASPVPLILGVGGAALVVIVVVLVLVLSGGREGSPTPTAAVRGYYDALRAGDLDGMKRHLSTDDLERFEKQIEELQKMGIDLRKVMVQFGPKLLNH